MTDNSPIPLIDKLVKEKNFILLTWDDRYSSGVWACCLPYLSQCEVVFEASTDGDLEMIPATEYLLNAKWLPVLIGSSAMDALQKLEARLAALPTGFLADDDWVYASGEAIGYLERTQNKYAHDYGAIDGNLKPLPNDYREIKFPQGWS
jgi:hypothetical protein